MAQEPFAVIDIAHESWAQLIADRQAYDLFMGWLLEEGFDPHELRRIEVYDTDSPFTRTPVWAYVHRRKRPTDDSTAETTIDREALSRVPPVPVLVIPGILRGLPPEG